MIVPSAFFTFWLKVTPWTVSPERSTWTRWAGWNIEPSADRLREAGDPGPHQPLEVGEPELRGKRAGTRVEHDLVVLGEQLVGQHRQAEEVAERRHGADVARRKAVPKFPLLGQTQLLGAEHRGDLAKIRSAVGGKREHDKLVSVGLDDHDLGQHPALDVLEGGDLQRRVRLGVKVNRIEDLLLLEQLLEFREDGHRRPPFCLHWEG